MSLLVGVAAMALAGQSLKSPPLDGAILMVAFTPDSAGVVLQTFHFADVGSVHSLYYTPLAGFTPKRVATTGESVALSPSGEFTATLADDSLTILRTRDGSPAFHATANTYQYAFAPKDDRLAFGYRAEINVADPRTGKIRTLVHADKQLRNKLPKGARLTRCDAYRWWPQGIIVDAEYTVPKNTNGFEADYFLVDPNNDRLVSTNPSLNEPSHRLSDGSVIKNSEWDRDRARIVRTFHGKRKVIFSAANLSAGRINNHDRGPAGVQASPRGMTVVVYGTRETPRGVQYYVWSVDPLTGKTRLLSSELGTGSEWWSEGLDMPVALSPDGKWVAFPDGKDERVLQLIRIR